MRRCLLLLILVVTVFPLHIAAQAQRLYKLHPVSPTEYLAAFQALPPVSPDDLDTRTTMETLIADFSHRYLTRDISIRFEDLYRIYHTLQIIDKLYLPLDRKLNQWNIGLMRAWLREHPIDLDTTPQFTVGDTVVDVTPRDFKGDGSHEWLLTLNTTPQALLEQKGNYLIAERGDKGGYHVIGTPLPWFSEGFSYWDSRSGAAQPLLFQDINGDGVPEWVVAVGGIGGNDSNYGWLSVLEWHEGKLVDLAGQNYLFDEGISYHAPAGGGMPIFPYGVSVEFVRSLSGKTTDIVIHQATFDNWNCTWIQTLTFGWNGTLFALARSNRVYDDVPGCAWRNAESHAWQGDFQAAIKDYQRGFGLPQDFSNEGREIKQYMQIRLAVAYALTGQNLAAGIVINLLKSEKPTSDLMRQLIEVLPNGLIPDAFSTCIGVYSVFATYQDKSLPDNEVEFYMSLPTNIFVGSTVDGGASKWEWWGPLPDPNHAGCDISLPVINRIGAYTINTSIPPTDQLRALGLTPAYALNFDLKQDGHGEWLVWLTLKTPPLFFAPELDGRIYHVSYAPFSDSFDSFNGIVRALPGNNRSVLIRVLPSNSINQPLCPQAADGTYWPSPTGKLIMWQLQAGTLIPIFSAPLCSADSLSTLFGSGPILPTSFQADAPVTSRKPGAKADLATANYTWSDQFQTYFPPPIVEQEDEYPPPKTIDLFQVQQTFDQNFNDLNYAAALKTIDHALVTNCPNCDNNTYLEFHYWRATALELLGRDNEAVSEYLFVAENAPTEAWHDLAMLHLEVVDF